MEKSKYTYIENRKAKHNYYVLDSYTAGISLIGSEVKSIRSSWVDLSEAYCVFNKSNELILKNCYIYKYNKIVYTREENIDRKLLLTKKELKKLKKDSEQPGFSIIPIAIIVNNPGFIKFKIALCKGKHNYDKREAIKKKDLERELKQTNKNYL